MPSDGPHIDGMPSSATPEEAAAVIAAIEQFLRDHAPIVVADEEPVNRWKRSALLEGVGYDPDGPSPWGDEHPWG